MTSPATGSRLARLALAAALLAGGCAAPAGPTSIRIEPDRYQAAFDAALGAARTCEMPATLRDRRSGIIETEPRIAPSLLEPWKDDGSTLARRNEQTIRLLRRRIRFEFTPAADSSPPARRLDGPDVVGMAAGAEDHSRYGGALDLRARVFIEQSHTPGVRRNTWSRSATTVTQIIPPDGEPLPARFWTAIARDPNFERRLLAMIERELQESDEGS